MKKKKVTRKKYATGTAVKNYMQDPATELAKNQINMTKAQQQVGNDDLTNFLSLLGNMGMQFGAGMAGDDNLSKAIAGASPLLGNMQFALGGNVGGGKPHVNSKNAVKALQTILKEKHYYDGNIDGDFGPKTTLAYNNYKNFSSRGKGEVKPSKIIPTHTKSLLNDLSGSNKDITEKSISKKELEVMQKAARTSLGEGRNSIGYGDYFTDDLDLADGTKAKKGKLNTLQKVYDPNYNMKTTVGRGHLVVTPDSDTLVVDRYNFNDAPGKERGVKGFVKGVAKNPSLYGTARSLGTNFGTPGGKDGGGASVIINTNEQMKMFGGMIQKMFAMGGEVTGEEQLDENNIPVEVEGGEMAETPDGQLLDFEGGPRHEEGGIPIDLPEGTEVFSDRIEIHGETPAERKRKREKKEEEIHKLLEKSPGDKVLLNTLKRLQESNAQEEAYDQDIQEQVAQSQEGEQEFAYGGKVRKKYVNGTNREGIKRLMDFDFGAAGPYSDVQSGKVMGDMSGNLDLNLPNLTPGDITGMLGTLYSTFAPMQNTLEQRAGDTPNINAFENYGENALGAMDNAMSMLDGQQEKALQDLELSKNTSMRSNRNTARGVNTMRSLDLGTDQATNQATGDIYSKFAEQAMNLLTNRAGMLNQQDQMRMTGEQARDVADREDRGSFYTQLGADKAAKGAGIQTLGKLLNQNKMNTVTESALGNLSKYGLFFDNRGIVVDGTGVPTSDADKERFAKSQGYSNFDSWLKDNQNRI